MAVCDKKVPVFFHRMSCLWFSLVETQNANNCSANNEVTVKQFSFASIAQVGCKTMILLLTLRDLGMPIPHVYPISLIIVLAL